MVQGSETKLVLKTDERVGGPRERVCSLGDSYSVDTSGIEGLSTGETGTDWDPATPLDRYICEDVFEAPPNGGADG